MTYSAVHKQLILDPNRLNSSIDGILWAMRQYRKSNEIPLGKRDKSLGNLSDFDMAERQLIQSLKEIGIDFGVEWGHQLDLTSNL